ncbi:MAG: FHA domain-containing protein [Euryarchaeota archaeon]|nr:FHA domain-containing protein [Euryarchaeota archaeon]
MMIDFDRLEKTLNALSYARRLELLSQLRIPRTMDEIRLLPGRARSGTRPERPISRQAVQAHLDQLVDAGFVRVRASPRAERKSQREYVLDESRLFAATEEFRAIASMRGRGDAYPDATQALSDAPRHSFEPGPKLLLVHGLGEGRAFPLTRDRLKADRGWIIGRKSGLHVALEYDPFVSGENSEIVPRANGFRLLDLRTARNGTSLNWPRLPVGADVPLEPGDLVGVGRTLLLFRAS